MNEKNEFKGKFGLIKSSSSMKFIVSSKASIAPRYDMNLPFTNFNNSPFLFCTIVLSDNDEWRIFGYQGGLYASEGVVIICDFDGNLKSVPHGQFDMDFSEYYDELKIKEFIEFFKENIDYESYAKKAQLGATIALSHEDNRKLENWAKSNFDVHYLQSSRKLVKSSIKSNNKLRWSKMIVKSNWEKTEMSSGTIWDKGKWRIYKGNYSDTYRLTKKDASDVFEKTFDKFDDAAAFADKSVRSSYGTSRKIVSELYVVAGNYRGEPVYYDFNIESWIKNIEDVPVVDKSTGQKIIRENDDNFFETGIKNPHLVLKSSREVLKSEMDQQKAQEFKEALIRAGYTEDQANEILKQSEAQQPVQSSSDITPMNVEFVRLLRGGFLNTDEQMKKYIDKCVRKYGLPIEDVKDELGETFYVETGDEERATRLFSSRKPLKSSYVIRALFEDTVTPKYWNSDRGMWTNGFMSGTQFATRGEAVEYSRRFAREPGIDEIDVVNLDELQWKI